MPRDATRVRPMTARHGAVSDPGRRSRDPMLDSGRARRPRSSRDPTRPRCRSPQGRDARGHPVRRVDPHRRRSGRGARRRARPDREVARLRHPGRSGWPEPVLCLVAGHNRVDLARLAAITSAPDIRRATAREAHDLTGFSIGGIPPIGTERAVRVIMDPDLGRYPMVWAAAGLPTAVFGVPPGTLRILSNAMVAPDRRGADGRPGRRADRRRGPARRRLIAPLPDDVERTPERDHHLSGRPARPLAMGRQRLRARGLRALRGGRRARRPEHPRRRGPRSAVPRRAPSRRPARRMVGALRVAHPRRAAGAPLGHRRVCSSSPTGSTPTGSRSRRATLAGTIARRRR